MGNWTTQVLYATLVFATGASLSLQNVKVGVVAKTANQFGAGQLRETKIPFVKDNGFLSLETTRHTRLLATMGN